MCHCRTNTIQQTTWLSASLLPKTIEAVQCLSALSSSCVCESVLLLLLLLSIFSPASQDGFCVTAEYDLLCSKLLS